MNPQSEGYELGVFSWWSTYQLTEDVHLMNNYILSKVHTKGRSASQKSLKKEQAPRQPHKCTNLRMLDVVG